MSESVHHDVQAVTNMGPASANGTVVPATGHSESHVTASGMLTHTNTNLKRREMVTYPPVTVTGWLLPWY